MTRIVKAYVGPDPLIPSDLEALVADSSAGAMVSFVGVVRDLDHDRSVAELEYEAHPDAGEVLVEILQDCCRSWPDITAVAVAHRTGLLGISEVAFVVCVSSPHRREGFAACQRIVEAVKERLPVWKRQVFMDGEQEWVNSL